jgi:hypothetical protein
MTVQAAYRGLVVEPPGYTRLVGDDYYAEIRFIQEPDRLRSPRDEPEILGPVQKLQFNIYGAVPIEENGSADRHEASQKSTG